MKYRVTLLALVLLLAVPKRCFAMLDLMGPFFAMAILVVVVTGAVVAAFLKFAILAMMGKTRASGAAICGVALLEIITMTLALFLSFVAIERYLLMLRGHEWVPIVSAAGLATLVQIMFTAVPNAWLIRTPENQRVNSIGTGVLLAALTPLVVTVVILNAAILIGR